MAQANWRPAEDEGNHNYDGTRVFGYTQWRKGWVKVSSELAQGRRALGTFIRDVVSSIGDAGSTRPGGNSTSSTRSLYVILLTNLKILVAVKPNWNTAKRVGGFGKR